LITPAPTVPAPMPAVAAPADERIRALFEAGSYDVVPHDNMRRVIARRLVEAKLTIPHFYLTLDCNIGKLLAGREEINALAPKDKEGKPAYKLSVNDFVIRRTSPGRKAPCSSTSGPTSGLRFPSRAD
jgi:pyruvate dehydrogenase E2 component (dihydrolipoamide acetyltransferase)